jgi:hypothetical protein
MEQQEVGGNPAPDAGAVDAGSSFLAGVASEGVNEQQAPEGLQTHETANGATEAALDAPPEWLPEKFYDPQSKQPKVEDLAKAYTNLEHLLGREKVPVPQDDNDEEGWQRWYDAVRPESIEAYDQVVRDAGGTVETDLPEGMEYDSELEEGFKEAAHASSLTPQQYNNLRELYVKTQTERYEQYTKMREEQRNHLQHQLQREYGREYPQQLNRAKTVMQKYADADFVQFLNDTGLGDDPRMVRFMARAGMDLSGETKLVGQPQMEAAPEDIDTAIRTFRDKNHKALMERDHPNHQAVVRELNKLYQARYGDSPA